MSNAIELLPIKQLLEMKFFIPSYQRGYRWGKQEITDLLNDIYEYQNEANSQEQTTKVGMFYCLQPVVVKGRGDGSYELIDGQQRLTTLWLILVYLEKIRRDCFDGETTLFTLTFETRENCEDFFCSRAFVDKVDDSNVDFYHISMAYSYIIKWFKERQQDRYRILSTILGDNKNVQVIFYSISETQTNTIDIFTRLNDGKIPLTDAELIKATLLQSDRYSLAEKPVIKQRLAEIASEWDFMEASLHDEHMWYMLTNGHGAYSTRIELLFDVLAKRWNKSYKIREQKYFIYYVIGQKIRELRKDSYNIESINEIWREVKDVFNLFQFWQKDHKLYHYIGFLLTLKPENIFDLCTQAQALNKDEFLAYIVRLISTKIKITSKDNDKKLKTLATISYGDDDEKIRDILLLHNIETLVSHDKERSRFPFSLYKIDKISSIEHIHPQNPEGISWDSARAEIWLKHHEASLNKFPQNEVGQFINEITKLRQDYDKKGFENLYRDVFTYYSGKSDFKEDEVHTLYNLALVDRDTNSSLNNSFFDIKREILKNSPKYIPICTQRAFGKYYSTAPDEMIFWGDADRKAYFADIEKVYSKFTLITNNDGID